MFLDGSDTTSLMQLTWHWERHQIAAIDGTWTAIPKSDPLRRAPSGRRREPKNAAARRFRGGRELREIDPVVRPRKLLDREATGSRLQREAL